MSRLFKQIQQAHPKEQILIQSLEPSLKREPKVNIFPVFCIVALFSGILVAYFYTARDISSSLPQKEISASLPINESPEVLAQDLQPSLPDIPATEAPILVQNVASEQTTVLAENASHSSSGITFHHLEWNFAPIKQWLQEHLAKAFPKFQEFSDCLNRFAYLDMTQPIPEKEISPIERERLELIQRFLKKFKIDAVRIDGSYSRVMANGQAFYVNTVVSQRPRLKLTEITSQEMIFKDEYNQEYRKEISQND